MRQDDIIHLIPRLSDLLIGTVRNIDTFQFGRDFCIIILFIPHEAVLLHSLQVATHAGVDIRVTATQVLQIIGTRLKLDSTLFHLTGQWLQARGFHIIYKYDRNGEFVFRKGDGNLVRSVPVVDMEEDVTMQSVLILDDRTHLHLRNGNLSHHVVLIDTFGEHSFLTYLGLHHLAVLYVVDRSLEVFNLLKTVFVFGVIDIRDGDVCIFPTFFLQYLDTFFDIVVYKVIQEIHLIFDRCQMTEHHGTGLWVFFVDGHVDLLITGLAELQVLCLYTQADDG